MTTVHVLWVSRYPDSVLARGYADQGFLEAMLARTVWTPQDALEFEHVEVHHDFPNVGGAVVVLPARHHASRADVIWLRRQLAQMEWSLVLLAGDEEWAFPWKDIPERKGRKVWTMQPIPGHRRLSGLLPGGWYPGTDTWLRTPEAAMVAGAREVDFMFAGQVTHERREQCWDVLTDIIATEPRVARGMAWRTDGYMQEAIERSAYFMTMADAKVIPCPSGPMHVDTARALEALEAGCIPVVDSRAPHQTEDPFDYWRLTFGEDVPFPMVTEWDEFPAVLEGLLDGWLPKANLVFSWWQQWKRRITRQLDADVRTVARLPITPRSADDLITVLVTASPTPSHPSLEHVTETVESIRARLPRAEILISVDGVRPEDEHRRAEYDEWTRRLLWTANTEWHNVLPVVMPEWLHQAGCTARLLELVETPLVLFMEHDTPLVGDPIPWVAICEAVQSGHANVVRFHHEAEVLAVHQHLMLDPDPILVPTSAGAVPLRRTHAWWQRPHVADAGFYRRLLARFTPDSRTMIEDPTYSRLESAVLDHGDKGWSRWKVTIYQPGGDMKRSTHLDGRAGDTKHAMWHDYR